MRSESRRAASAAFGCEETAFEGFGANLKSFRARFRCFWLPGLGPNSRCQMPDARCQMPGARGEGPANTPFQNRIRDAQAATTEVSSGEAVVFGETPPRYRRCYGRREESRCSWPEAVGLFLNKSAPFTRPKVLADGALLCGVVRRTCERGLGLVRLAAVGFSETVGRSTR